MPFAIAETKSVDGSSELCAVPDLWIQGKILFWPNIKNAKSLDELLRNEKSLPKQAWSKVAAKVKRQNIASYEEAELLINEMSNNSSTDELSIPVKKSRISVSTKQAESHIFQSMIQLANVERVDPNPSFLANDNIGNLEDDIPQSSGINQTTSSFEPSILVTEGNVLTTIDKSEEILSWFSKLDDRLTRMSDRVESIATQMNFVMDALNSSSQTCGVNQFHTERPYPKARDEKQLENLEASLEDQEFKEKWIKWLTINTSRSECSEKRMLSMLDLIMTKELQAQCSWTGASRTKGQHKICVLALRNILAIFQKIGMTDTEIVTQEKLANFFMKKLKNASKRTAYAGKRMSSRHVFSQRGESDDETSN